MKYTTTELIKILKRFPDDTPISNDLCFIWDYPEEIKFTRDFEENPILVSQANATSLGLFEGSWDNPEMESKAVEFQKINK